jgi:Mrp family chromosome partitioning ATPase/DUF971 family protein
MKRSLISLSLLKGKLEQDIINVLSNVIEPGTKKSLSSIGALQSISIDNNSKVKVDIDLFVPGHPYKDNIINECKDLIRKNVNWAKDITVQVVTEKQKSTSNAIMTTGSDKLSIVHHAIAVSSCKGGVGKSTVAVNLALTLAKRGLRVGLLDADIYGTSLPVMINTSNQIVKRSKQNPKFVLPLDGPYGLKMLSFGHVNPDSGAPGGGVGGAAVLRGPIASKIINQLISATEWGELDYLIIDMPPGTGDIQITTGQSMALSGALLVTTPHALSIVDAVKGLVLFEEVEVPTLSIIENMAYFEDMQGNKHYPFGNGGRDNLVSSMTHFLKNINAVKKKEKLQTNLLNRLATCPFHSLPMNETIAGVTNTKSIGEGTPYIPLVQQYPDSKYSKIYSTIADDMILEILKLQLKAHMIPSMTYIESRGIILRYFTSSNAIEFSIPPAELRVRDPKTGKRLLDRSIDQFKGVKPIHFDYKGNYGVAINWTDGHYADIFAYEILREIAEDIAKKVE